MKSKKTIATIIRVLKKVFFWSATAIVSLALCSILLLQAPWVQNAIKDKVLAVLYEKSGQNIHVKNIQVKWFDQVFLKGLQIDDYKGNVLLSASGVEVNYNISNLLTKNHLYLDDAYILNGELNLVKYDDTLAVNIAEFVNGIKSLKGDNQTVDSLKQPLKITISQVELEHFQVGYDNFQKERLEEKYLDLAHFNFIINQAGFDQFEVKKDTITTMVSYLIGEEEYTRFPVREFKSNFRLTNKEIALENLFLKTPNSVLGDTLLFSFDSFQDLNQFATLVRLNINLNEAKIDQYDLSYFSALPREHRMIVGEADILGTIPDLSIRRFSIKYNDHSTLKGGIDFIGLPKIDEAFIDANISSGALYPEDFAEYIGEFKSNLLSLGAVRFSGSFLGFINDFVANANFDTEKGRVYSDINLKFPEGFADAKYSGRLVLDDFHAGDFIDNSEVFQRVNLDGEIDGQGFGIDNASFQLNADITNTGIFGYDYEYIKADGEFAASYFRGSLLVDDPHCKINGEGTLNLGIIPEEIEVRGTVDQLDFKPLGFSEKEISLKTTVFSNFTGLNIDSLVGKIQFDSTFISYEDKSILFDTISLAAERNNTSRFVDIDLKEAHLRLEGNFYFSQLVSDADLIAREFAAYFEPELEQRVSIYKQLKDTRDYEVNMTLEYKDLNPYINFLTEDLVLSKNGLVEGTYYQRKNATLFLYTKIDSVKFRGVTYYDNTIDINASKDMDSLGVIANIYLNSERQQWIQIPETKNMSIEATWFNNDITLQGHVEQPQNNSSALVNAEMKLLKDKILFNFKPSNMVAFGDRWFFNPFNKIEIGKESILIDRLELYNGEQSVSLKGIYSSGNETNLLLNFKQFDLVSISPITPIALNGILTSEVRLNKSEKDSTFQLLTEIDLKDLIVDDLLVGNINGSSDWVKGLQAISMDLVVQREAIRTITMEGYYYPFRSEDQLEVAVEFDQANVKLFEPLFRSLFSNIEGSASGSVSIGGNLSYPILNGYSRVENGKFRFDYLGTTYSYNGDINFNNESILLNRMQIRDRDGDMALLNGNINHKGFRNFSIDLDISANNFLFLNTSSTDNDLYYGSAKGTGDIKVSGPVTDLLIKAKATTEAGTKISIPLEDNADVDQKDYISFIDLTDTSGVEVTEEQVRNSISGITLDFDLDITNRAYLELIRDIRTGDIIKGRGVGNLNMKLDTQGEFQLFGEITISEGGYNFTIPNFINKEFSISSGSTISWFGDPYQGILDLKAVYRQMASLSDYTSATDPDAASRHQRLPYLVILDLTGEMLSPQIDFDIRVDESSAQLQVADQVALSDINNNEQELKRQVFSLLILKKFSVKDGFSIGGGSVGSSLSEFVSNQFSYFISQVDENLEVDIDLSSFTDANAFNTFQLRLAYTFLGGRLRVSGGGLVAQNSPSATSENFFGDWSVRYMLTKDGHLRIKAFSQTKQGNGSAVGSNNSANFFRETGMSFQYVNSFNEFSDLLKKSRDKAIEEKNAESKQPPVEQKDSVSVSTRI
ncbi:MAG: translocation/assembly module TamB domain-containing protein [Bacteroidota bacterium]